MKPQIDTIKEWMRCLGSSTHAETTWLRIERKHEDTAVLVVKMALAALFVAMVLMWVHAFHNLARRHYLQNHPQVITVQLMQGERFQ